VGIDGVETPEKEEGGASESSITNNTIFKGGSGHPFSLGLLLTCHNGETKITLWIKSWVLRAAKPYNTVLYLIELAVELDGMIILEGPFRLYAENCIKINVGRTMQVRFLLRLYRKAPVIDRQIGDEELVCLVYRAHALQSHLLDHPVLECVEQTLDPSFGLKKSGHGAF
jgi:hypothetical protein